MKYLLAALCCGCVFSDITALVPAPAAPRDAQTPASRPAANRAETSLTLIGCLKYWDGGTDATAGASSTPSRRPAGPAAKYMLENVESRNQSGGVPAPSYALAGDSTVNLAGHVNQKVQVSGVIDADGYGHPTDARSPASLPTLRVTSLKMLSTPCP